MFDRDPFDRIWKRDLRRKMEEGKRILHNGGLSERPEEALYVLISEIRGLNARLTYLLGTLTVITGVLVAHII